LGVTGTGRVIVAGGGIAGIACALRLAERGVRVTLLETRRKLGGRATSFVDARTGETLDNCQHVALACCTNYLDLLDRLDALDKITWTSEQYWVQRGGVVSVVAPGLLPAPFHFMGSILGARFLTWGEKNRLGDAMRAIVRAERAAWASRTFAEFLRASNQSQRAIEVFWAPVVISACNVGVDRVSAASALQVFQEGFLAHRHAADIGVSRVPLLELYDRAEGVIERAGGEIRLGCSVERLGAASVDVFESGTRRTLHAERVVCALPPERAAAVIDPELVQSDARLRSLGGIEHSPILGVHLRGDGPLMHLPHAVLVEGATQWLFRKDDRGCAVHAVISAADEWMGLNEAEIGRRVVADLHAYFPESRGVPIASVRSVKEKRATFLCTPEVEALRPEGIDDRQSVEAGAGARRDGLILAGDYTRTGWPATMEGATRSGYTAAGGVLGVDPRSMLVADMVPAWGARLAGLRGAGLRGASANEGRAGAIA
jgi:squalene-associated FAD-dependent desaturase